MLFCSNGAEPLTVSLQFHIYWWKSSLVFANRCSAVTDAAEHDDVDPVGPVQGAGAGDGGGDAVLPKTTTPQQPELVSPSHMRANIPFLRVRVRKQELAAFCALYFSPASLNAERTREWKDHGVSRSPASNNEPLQTKHTRDIQQNLNWTAAGFSADMERSEELGFNKQKTSVVHRRRRTHQMMSKCRMASFSQAVAQSSGRFREVFQCSLFLFRS